MTPLHSIGEAIRQALMTVPLGAARALFLLFLAALLVWVLLLPKEQTSRTSTSPTSENLKWWALLALSIQFVVYALL